MVVGPLLRDDLDLATAAAELAVHYRTAYRWVRDGSLPARVAKGAYRIDRAALEAFVEHRRRSAGQRARRTAPTPAQRADQRDRFRDALLVGDEQLARSLARRALSTMSVTELLDQIVAPSMHDVGLQWQQGTLTIWTEHRATAIVGRILGDVAPRPRGRRRGRAVVASVAGDRHALATEMAVAALREDHWRVHHLGSDVPGDEIVDFCRSETVDIAVLTVTVSIDSSSLMSVQERLAGLGVRAIVGGPGRTLSELQILAGRRRSSATAIGSAS